MASNSPYKASFLVEDEEYWDPVGIEYIPTLYLNGLPVSFRQQQVRMRTREKTIEYRGIANATDAQLVGGTDMTFVAASNTDKYSFTSYSKRAHRRRINEADMWRVTVKERWCALYVLSGGVMSRVAGAADSAFTNNQN